MVYPLQGQVTSGNTYCVLSAMTSKVVICQLRAKLLCTQLTMAYVAEMSCISCY